MENENMFTNKLPVACFFGESLPKSNVHQPLCQKNVIHAAVLYLTPEGVKLVIRVCRLLCRIKRLFLIKILEH